MRLLGIDSIRFFCASVVVLGHFGNPPLFSDVYDYIFFYKILHGIYNCLFNGPAAVVAFFMISGLVIHYPYVDGKELNIWEFYTKRYIRIIIPMLIVTILGIFLGNIEAATGVFWSLYAELIYYFLYPFILKLKKHINLILLILIAYSIGLILIILTPSMENKSYVYLGNGLTWIIGLPCWLTGVLLAERVRNETEKVTFKKLSFLRLLVWGLTICIMVLRFHMNISYILLLNILIIPFYYWLKNEVDYYKTHNVNVSIENMGKWSYSLYIVHPLIGIFFLEYDFVYLSNPWIHWVVMTSAAFILSYAFYFLVEKSSHLLAQKIRINRS